MRSGYACSGCTPGAFATNGDCFLCPDDQSWEATAQALAILVAALAGLASAFLLAVWLMLRRRGVPLKEARKQFGQLAIWIVMLLQVCYQVLS